jgi:hypothetical protein
MRNPLSRYTELWKRSLNRSLRANQKKRMIAVHGADDLYREIRVENTLHNANGEKVRLKPGAEVDVTIEASVDAVEKKTD